MRRRLTTRAAFQPGESTLEEKVDLVLLQLQETQRAGHVEVTNNPDANFLLFAEQARKILGNNIPSDKRQRNIEITGLNETITIDMKDSPTEALSLRRIEKLAEHFGYDVVIKNVPHLT
jgi:hypothetical protein